MKYIILIILNIIVIIGAFFLFDYCQKKKNNDSSFQKYYFLSLFCYFTVIPTINFIAIKSMTRKTINYYYNISEIQDKINEIDKSIAISSDNIKKYYYELRDIQYEKIEREFEDNKLKKEELTKNHQELNSNLNKLKDEFTNLNNKYNELEKKTIFKIENFPTVNQHPNYPNGCEIAALHLLLKYYGIDVNLEELANNLDKGPAPFENGGISYGADPENKFVGDPRKTNKQGYGVYQKPIAKLANMYKSGIIDYTGHDLDSVLKIVGSGKPVQVWASINLRETSICQSWIDVETGKKINWRCNLHSMVLIGYGLNEVIVSDPYTGRIRLFSKSQFEKIYNNYGKRALYYE